MEDMLVHFCKLRGLTDAFSLVKIGKHIDGTIEGKGSIGIYRNKEVEVYLKDEGEGYFVRMED